MATRPGPRLRATRSCCALCVPSPGAIVTSRGS